jgi:hypothetical protein
VREKTDGTTAVTWEADVLPITARIGDDPAARPAMLLVAVGALPAHVDLLSHPPSDAAGVARTLEDAVATAMKTVGEAPPGLVVRAHEVASLLSRSSLLHDIPVHASSSLPMIDTIFGDMAASMSVLGAGARVASPETWAGWDLPPGDIVRIFEAAAAFHEAAPWRFVTNEQVLEATFPDGHTWTICVLGNGGVQFGLALYEHPDDVFRFLDADDRAEPFAGASGAILSLTFDDALAIPKRMRSEITKRRWKVAGPAAYPVLVAVNTIAGGVTREQAADLATLLDAVPAFIERHRSELTGASAATLPIEWTAEPSGVRLGYRGAAHAVDSLWEPLDALTPALAAGPGAEPGASLVGLTVSGAAEMRRAQDAERATIARFQRWLSRGKKTTSAVRRQAEDGRLFVEFLAGVQGIPVRAISEFDLRIFLYDWYPRKVRADLRYARTVHTMLGRFFAFLAEKEEIACSWAEQVLDERQIFEERVETFPGGFWWDEEVQLWQEDLWNDLDARVMTPDPSLGDGEEWGPTMGMTEHVLHQAVQRQWLLWRDEVIRAGTTAPAAVHAALVPRQRAWVRAPLSELAGRTPIEAIRQERLELRTRAESGR